MKNKEKSEFIDSGTGVDHISDDTGAFPDIFKVKEDTEKSDVDKEDSPEEDEDHKVTIVQDINDKFILNKVGQRTYWNKPWHKGQFNQEGMHKLGPPVTKTFNLSDEKSLNEYNDLMKQVGADGDDPSIIIVYHDRLFWLGSYIALVTYNEVWYLLPKL